MGENNDIMGVDAIARLSGLLNSLSPSEKRIGEYIIKNQEDIPLMTLADVATNSGVSDATAVRFFKSLGYNRWLDFKIALAQTTHSTQALYKELTSSDSVELVAKKVIQGSIVALEETAAVIDAEKFKTAVDLLENANRVLIVGAGTSGPIAHELFNRLFRLGMKIGVETDAHLQVMQCALLTSKDVVVAISHTGESNNTINTATIAKKRGASVISITSNRLSELAKLSDVVLLAISHELLQETIASRIAQHAITHALYISLAMRCSDICVKNEKAIWDALLNVNAMRATREF